MRTMPWWRWVAATVAIVFLWIYGAAIAAVLTDMFLPESDAPWRALFRDLMTFVPFFFATPLVWRYSARQPVARLVRASGAPSARRLATGFGWWLLLSTLASGVDWLLHRGDYRLTFDAGVFLPFLLVTVLLLPMQSWAEELFFRGWILRWSEHLLPWTRIGISGAVFALPHLGNPEAAGQATLALAAWFLLGAGWAFVSLRDGGLELAMGAHLANNVFSLLIVSYDDAALPTSGLVTTSTVDVAATVVSLLVMVPAFAWLSLRSARQ